MKICPLLSVASFVLWAADAAGEPPQDALDEEEASQWKRLLRRHHHYGDLSFSRDPPYHDAGPPYHDAGPYYPDVKPPSFHAAPYPHPVPVPYPRPVRVPVPHPIPQPVPQPTSYPPPYPEPNPAPHVTAPSQPYPAPHNTDPHGPTSMTNPSSDPGGKPHLTQDIDCHLKVDLECKTDYGEHCSYIRPPPDYGCSHGKPLGMITFKYDNNDCLPDGHKQGEDSFCEDISPIRYWDPVDVYCRKTSSSSALRVEPRKVQPGGTFTVSHPNGEDLPDSIDCVFRNAKGELLQHNIINTSGRVPLFLKDHFGAFTVYSCDALYCFKSLFYEIDVTNVGLVDMEIEELKFEFNSQEFNLLSQLETKVVSRDGNVVMEAQVEVDVCDGDFTFKAHAQAEGYPIDGGERLCYDVDDLHFKLDPDREVTPSAVGPQAPDAPISTSVPTYTKYIPSPVHEPTPKKYTMAPAGASFSEYPERGDCSIDADIKCTLSSGKDCKEAHQPKDLLCRGRGEELSFTYQYCSCHERSNSQGPESSCYDYDHLVEDKVSIFCKGLFHGENLAVYPQFVEPSERFSVSTTSGKPLPKKIECTIFGPHQNALQSNVFDASGYVPLQLGDKFGAMQLESCGEKTCKEIFHYSIQLSNTGRVPALFTDASFQFNELRGSVYDGIKGNPLNPGKSTEVEVKFDLDICNGIDYCSSVEARARPPDGYVCHAYDKHVVEFHAVRKDDHYPKTPSPGPPSHPEGYKPTSDYGQPSYPNVPSQGEHPQRPTYTGSHPSGPSNVAPTYPKPSYPGPVLPSYNSPVDRVDGPRYPDPHPPSYAAPTYPDYPMENYPEQEGPGKQDPAYQAPSYPGTPTYGYDEPRHPYPPQPTYVPPTYPDVQPTSHAVPHHSEQPTYRAPSYPDRPRPSNDGSPAQTDPPFPTYQYGPPSYPDVLSPSVSEPSYDAPTPTHPDKPYQAPTYPSVPGKPEDHSTYDTPTYSEPHRPVDGRPRYPDPRVPTYSAPTYPSHPTPGVSQPSYKAPTYPESDNDHEKGPMGPPYVPPTYTDSSNYVEPKYQLPTYTGPNSYPDTPESPHHTPTYPDIPRPSNEAPQPSYKAPAYPDVSRPNQVDSVYPSPSHTPPIYTEYSDPGLSPSYVVPVYTAERKPNTPYPAQSGESKPAPQYPATNEYSEHQEVQYDEPTYSVPEPKPTYDESHFHPVESSYPARGTPTSNTHHHHPSSPPRQPEDNYSVPGPHYQPDYANDDPCVLDLFVTDCIIGGDSGFAGESCSEPHVGVQPCTDRPVTMKLLLTGDDCSSSRHNQPTTFDCTDYASIGSLAHVVVADPSSSVVYFDGHVEFGDFLELHDYGKQLGEFLHITIYSPIGEHLQQETYVHSGCDGDLSLYDQLGALKLMEYYNVQQGLVSFIGSFELSLLIDVSGLNENESVTLTNLILDTNYAGSVDVSGQIQRSIKSQETLKIELPGKMDLSKVYQYVLRFKLSGVRNPDFGVCEGVFTLDFSAGYAGGGRNRMLSS